MVDHIAKPIRREALYATLEKLADRGRRAEAGFDDSPFSLVPVLWVGRLSREA
jgi:hypothetical protein